jgi:hypothetical protein
MWILNARLQTNFMTTLFDPRRRFRFAETMGAQMRTPYTRNARELLHPTNEFIVVDVIEDVLFEGSNHSRRQ